MLRRYYAQHSTRTIKSLGRAPWSSRKGPRFHGRPRLGTLVLILCVLQIVLCDIFWDPTVVGKTKGRVARSVVSVCKRWSRLVWVQASLCLLRHGRHTPGILSNRVIG